MQAMPTHSKIPPQGSYGPWRLTLWRDGVELQGAKADEGATCLSQWQRCGAGGGLGTEPLPQPRASPLPGMFRAQASWPSAAPEGPTGLAGA